MHCPLSGYHDAGCCEKTTCDCWCHEKSEHRGSRAHMDDAVPVKPPGIPAEIEERIERYLGVRR
jgi:hypothetical protein